MGLLDTIGNVLGGVTGGQVFTGITGLLGAGMGMMGQENANEANLQIAQNATQASAAQAKAQMDFQQAQNEHVMGWEESMSDTSIQRRVKDLEAAGLNPMLAYSQGGASQPSVGTPSGAQGDVKMPAPMQNVYAAGMNSAAGALEASRAASEIDVNTARKTQLEADAKARLASAGQLSAEEARVRQEMTSFDIRLQKLGFDRELSSYAVIEALRKQQMDFPQMQADLARASELKKRAELLGLDIPEAIARADWYRTTIGHESPAIEFGAKRLGDVMGTAVQGRRALGSGLRR